MSPEARWLFRGWILVDISSDLSWAEQTCSSDLILWNSFTPLSANAADLLNGAQWGTLSWVASFSTSSFVLVFHITLIPQKQKLPSSLNRWILLTWHNYNIFYTDINMNRRKILKRFMTGTTSDINSSFLPGANTKLLKEAMSLVPPPPFPPLPAPAPPAPAAPAAPRVFVSHK